MYIDIVLLLIVIGLAIMYFKNFSAFVFAISISDILLRTLAFIRTNLGLHDLQRFLKKYFPDSIFDIIDKHTNGDLNLILKWIFVIITIFFLYYVIKIWLKKKKF